MSDSSPKLLPCPFCGGSAKEQQAKGSFGGYKITRIYCQGCGSSAHDRMRWNSRMNPDEEART